MYKLLNKQGLVVSTLVGVAILVIALMTSSADFALRGSYFLIIVAAVASLALPIFFAKEDPKSLIGIGISVGVIAALFLIVYSTSSNELLPQYIAQSVSPGEVQFSGAMITTMMVMVVVAVVTVVATEVYNIFRK